MKEENKLAYKFGDKTLTSTQLVKVFLSELKLIHERDSLIARVILETFARIHTVLSLSIRDLSSVDNIISFQRGIYCYSTEISEDLMVDLRKYIEETKEVRGSYDRVFITTTGSCVTRARLNYTLERIGKKFTPALEINPEFLRDVGWAIQMRKMGDI